MIEKENKREKIWEKVCAKHFLKAILLILREEMNLVPIKSALFE